MTINPLNQTFMGIPSMRADRSRMAILGIPLESGNHALRGGSRLGPEAVRRQSQVLPRFSFEDDVDVIQEMGLYDAGDVAVTHGDIPASFRAIEEAVQSLLSERLTPLGIGGDGTVTLPQLRAVAKRFPKISVVHIDAHTDAYPYPGYYGATAFTRAVEEGLVDATRSFHIGMRDPVSAPNLRKFVTELGYNVVTMRELRRRGIDVVAADVRAKIADAPVYLCYDVDVFEPCVVPGVFTPLCDGALPYEGLELLRSLAGLNVVHFDINNVTPPHDLHGYTALLGAHIIWTCVSLQARGRTGQT